MMAHSFLKSGVFLSVIQMKKKYYFFFLLFSPLLWSQNPKEYDHCKTNSCRILASYKLSKQYLESDDIPASQKWLNKTKDLYPLNKTDTLACSIHNLQSELFYYMGLFQFGSDEAEKAIEKSRQINDSLLTADAYFFLGINQFELKKYEFSQQSLQQSLRYYPKIGNKKRISNSIDQEYIYNNLAQVKLKINQQDDALLFNRLAYKLAKANNSKRGIPNTEQTFGEIYLAKKEFDSSRIYFEKSVQSALKSDYYDITLVNYGFLAAISPELKTALQYYQKGIDLIEQQTINAFFRRFFYELILKSLQKNGATEKVIEVQHKIIQIDNEGRLNANTYIQDISEQYVNNEKKLLTAETEKFRRQRNITILLVISALLCIAVMALGIIIIRRKNKEKHRQEIIRLESLLDGQEKERKRIAEELHDGLNGDLSAIKYRLSGLEDTGLQSEDRENLEKTIEMIDNACTQVRRISHNLMPSSILDFGLVETVNQYCSKINSSHPLSLDFQYFGNPLVLPKKAETVIYRIIQELLNNIIKHSKATTALVQLNFHENDLFVTVEDNGVGFDLKTAKNGLGLKNIESRIQFLKADLNIDSNEKGTSFQIHIDLNSLQS